MHDEKVLAQIEQDIAQQQERLGNVLLDLQAEIDDAREELALAKKVRFTQRVKRLEEQLTNLESQAQQEQEAATRNLAASEALRAEAMSRKNA